MIPIPPNAIEALHGSRQGESLEISAWYEGRCTVQSLPVESWTLTDDASRQIRRQLSIKVRDDVGRLAPMEITDPLAAAGQRLVATHVLTGGERVVLGEFIITNSRPAVSWLALNKGTDSRLVCGGANIELNAVDLNELVKSADFFSPESPAEHASVIGEIKRLCEGILPVYTKPGVQDRPLNSTKIYDTGNGSRMNAVEDLAHSIGAFARMGGDTTLYIEPADQPPVWDILPGEEGTLISVDFEMSIDRFYNAAVSSNSGGETEVLASAILEHGPLRWNGPIGRRPTFHSSQFIRERNQALADAQRLLEAKTGGMNITLNVSCLNHPGLQSSDLVRIQIPTEAAHPTLVSGIVKSIDRKGDANGVGQMDLNVNVDMSEFVGAVRGK